MKRMGKMLWLPLILLLMMIPVTSPQAQQRSEDRNEDEIILVGRISYVTGEILRYVPEEEDWVAVVKDTPFGLSDALHSDKGGRAEIIMPNNTWARIDGDTQIQLIALRDDMTEIEVSSGVARFTNKGSDAVIKAGTPFGYVMASGDTSFDVYVSDDSAEVVGLMGTVYFVHATSETRFEVIAGSSSIIADRREVTAGHAHTDPFWEAWNSKRDVLWARRMRIKGKSVEYLPPRLHHDAYVLEKHGRWERVYYDGEYHYFWRPLYVGAGWAPFTVGRWIVWYGDHTWIPYEPFGYVTHHYGNWIFVGGFWYWAPPVPFVRVHIGPPLLPIAFFWYPGRVAWIHFGVHFGWMPLGPWEPYYCYRRWGPRSVTVKKVNITNINTNVKRYKYFKHAVIIDKKNLYRGKSYKKVRIRTIHYDAILKNYRAVPVVNNRVIKNYRNIRQRYNVTNVNVTRKPHRTAIKKIHEDQLAVKQSADIKAKAVRKGARNTKSDTIPKGAQIRPLNVKERGVPVNKIRRSPSKGKSEERKLNSRAKFRGGDQRRVRSEAQKRLRKIPPNLVKRQALRGKEQRDARSRLPEGGGGIPPRPGQKIQKRPERSKESKGKTVQRWHPGKQYQKVQRRGSEKYWEVDFSPRLPRGPGAPRGRSRPDFARK